MIRNCIFLCKSLEISYFWTKFPASRHAQLAIYAAFHEESESAVRIDQFLHPGEKINKKQPTRVSISYRTMSCCMSPPCKTCIRHQNVLTGLFAILKFEIQNNDIWEIALATVVRPQK